MASMVMYLKKNIPELRRRISKANSILAPIIKFIKDWIKEISALISVTASAITIIAVMISYAYPAGAVARKISEIITRFRMIEPDFERLKDIVSEDNGTRTSYQIRYAMEILAEYNELRGRVDITCTKPRQQKDWGWCYRLNELQLGNKGANLGLSILRANDFDGSNFTGANLDGADLSYASLKGAIMTNASLVGANITGANLAGAILTGANFDTANISGAIFYYGGTPANVTMEQLAHACIYNESGDELRPIMPPGLPQIRFSSCKKQQSVGELP